MRKQRAGSCWRRCWVTRCATQRRHADTTSNPASLDDSVGKRPLLCVVLQYCMYCMRAQERRWCLQHGPVWPQQRLLALWLMAAQTSAHVGRISANLVAVFLWLLQLVIWCIGVHMVTCMHPTSITRLAPPPWLFVYACNTRRAVMSHVVKGLLSSQRGWDGRVYWRGILHREGVFLKVSCRFDGAAGEYWGLQV